MNLDAILKIEEKYQMEKRSIDGYPYWMLFRFELVQEIVKSADGSREYVFTMPQTAGERLKLALKRLIVLLESKYYYKKPVDCFFISNGRRISEEGFYINTILDDVIRMYPESLLFEYPIGGTHFRPAKTEHIHYSDRYGLAARLVAEIHRIFRSPRFSRIYRTIADELRIPLQEMCDAYQVRISWDPFFLKMTLWYFEYFSLRRSYGQLLKKTAPKALLVSCS